MKTQSLLASALAVTPVIFLSSPSFADGPAQAFGRQGHLAISSDANISLSNVSVSGTTGSTTTFVLHPAADYFVIPRLSVGGYIPFEYTSTSNGGGNTTVIGIGARVGYDVPLGDSFSFWPRGGFGFTSETYSTTNGNVSVSTSNSALTLNIFAPFLLHPVEHFFLGLGPELNVDLTGDNRATLYGISFIVGGHCLGD